MKSKWCWLLISCLMVAALALSSCGPAEEDEEEEVTEEEVSEEETEEEEVADEEEELTEEAPKYGGTITIIKNADTAGFDDAWASGSRCYQNMLTHEEILQGDWARGPAGTGEVNWSVNGFEAYDRKYAIGELVDSWEVTGPNNNIMSLQVRKGVYFHNKPPTNGREMTVDDVIYSINRQWLIDASFLKMLYPPGPVSITNPEGWTVEVEWPSLADLASNVLRVLDLMYIWPRDALEANNNDMRDWRVSVGTGPFMITDYVKGSSMTFIRNPNYWDNDPVGPGKGNQLPYLDGVKYLIIPDASTQAAAIRTHKADQGYFSWETAKTLLNSNPELQSARSLVIQSFMVKMRLDDPSFPWTDITVRQALHMSIDYQEIADTYYGGEAEIYNYPAPANPEGRDLFIPLNQLPQNVQDLFKYQPDKAKQMLVDAGYADGFDMQVVCQTQHVDLLSIYKEYWAKIGVNLILDPKEYAVFNSIYNASNQEQGVFMYNNMNVIFKMVDFVGKQKHNANFIDDARLTEAKEQIGNNYLNFDKQVQIYKDLVPYILEQAWAIPSPAVYDFNLWQPWIKNYHGEVSVGNNNRESWAKYVWFDQDMRKEMIGK